MKIIPTSAVNRMLEMLDRRTFWCISRQRCWGVPIPVFYQKDTGESLINRYSSNYILGNEGMSSVVPQLYSVIKLI